MAQDRKPRAEPVFDVARDTMARPRHADPDRDQDVRRAGEPVGVAEHRQIVDEIVLPEFLVDQKSDAPDSAAVGRDVLDICCSSRAKPRVP